MYVGHKLIIHKAAIAHKLKYAKTKSLAYSTWQLFNHGIFTWNVDR